jgi:hypothetical protein
MTQRFSYSSLTGARRSFPWLPITLSLGERSVNAYGLLDSGATVNVLPYQVGLELGAVWENQNITMDLSGNLARFEARGLLLLGTVAPFTPLELGFAWTKTENVPLILGQANFFEEFDVCFFRSEFAFEVTPRKVP